LKLTIISLCDFSGAWSRPYQDAGYTVLQVDVQHGTDVRLFEALRYPVRGVLAAPPCTEFARSGARWWPRKGTKPLLEALAVVDSCCRIILMHRPTWWALENPVGRLNRWLGPPTMYFHPADFGDAWTKRTCLWGNFNPPTKRPVEVTEDSRILRMPDSAGRANERAETPAGFAQAFFEANP
jgi:hypothetical protein